jgi:hypothetical protein
MSFAVGGRDIEPPRQGIGGGDNGSLGFTMRLSLNIILKRYVKEYKHELKIMDEDEDEEEDKPE